MDEAFVYLWQDARETPYKYYLGYHKGTPNDGYTHSSKVFESFSKDNIPNGVRRRILATGSTEEMMELENKLLNNRKDSKWDRYYNVMTNFPPYMWEDPEYRKMQVEMNSERQKKRWEDPEYRKRQSERMGEQAKKLWQDPKYRKMKLQQMSEKAKAQWQDPEFRKRQSERMSEKSKKIWDDPEFRKMKTKEMKEKATCDVCGFVANRVNIARWHNDNCKHKDTTTLENFLND